LFGYAFWDDMLPGDDIPPLDGISRSTGAARQKVGAHSDGSANCRETYSRASSTAIRVLLADHRQLVRCALRYLLDEAYDTHVVAEASDGAEVLSKFAAARPDVCVLDACMPRTDNCGMLASILSIDAEARILLVTMNSDPLSAALALHAGASGCISKHADVSDLYDAIRCVARKRRYLPLESRAGAVQPLLGFGSLSNREEQILSRVAAGRTQRDIALELEIDTRTVGTYLSRAANKLGLDSNLEVCLRAARSNRLLASLR
jgi:DNA-binding NarL/FixJ family response regulator